MRKRTQAREYVLQALYNWEVSEKPMAECLASVVQIEGELPAESLDFAERLLSIISDKSQEIDKVISKFADNWSLDRMAIVDKNILRLATAELLFMDEIPPKVSINEAIELAKRFGDQDTYRFVNGILDRIRKELCPTK